MRFFFIHGSGCTGAVFAAQLAAFHDAYAITLPGHRAGDAAGPSTIDGFADAVAAELTQRHFDDAVLCGNSLGGAIALEVALRGDERVRGIVTIGSGARLRVAPAIFESLESDFPAAARSLAARFYADATPARIDASVALMCEVGQAQTVRDFRACDAFDATERLGELRTPLLALTGASDALTPPKFGQFLADRVPGAVARILDGAGHLAMVERPDDTNAALRAFVESIVTR